MELIYSESARIQTNILWVRAVRLQVSPRVTDLLINIPKKEAHKAIKGHQDEKSHSDGGGERKTS